MSELQMGMIESRFADIIWGSEPVSTSELTKKAEVALGWKKSTMYTVLKRLCNKGIFDNSGGIVTSLISKADFYSLQSERFVDETFAGSLPAFLAAFTARNRLKAAEIAELRRMIEEYDERGGSE